MGTPWCDDNHKSRFAALRELFERFERNAEALFGLIQKGSIEKPKKDLNWNHVRVRMQKKEYLEFFRETGQKDKNTHKSYVQRKIAYWREPANILWHFLLVSEKPGNATLLTAHKRTAVGFLGIIREEVSKVKRERLVEEEPKEHISRRREPDCGI